MKTKKILLLLLALTVIFAFAACKGKTTANPQQTTAPGAVQEGVPYTVAVKSVGGMALADVEVYAYKTGNLNDILGYGKTDADGKATVSLPAGGDYAVMLSGLPKGYQIADSYSFNGTHADITLTSSLVMDSNLAGASLGLGDVMYDFSVTANGGETVKLSEMLKEKDMVLINFWYSTCGPCDSEFPYMEKVYQQYKDKVGIIALDPLEDATTVSLYQGQKGLSFPMAACPAAWSNTFSVGGYPTSIVVDRYGVICLMETGALTSQTPFASMFEYFSGDDYVQKLCPNGVADVIVPVKPTTTMPAAEEIAAVLNNGDIPVTYLNASESDLEYNWAFVIGDKDGTPCIMSTNKEIENAYSIIRMQVELKAGQALGLDYIVSSEAGADVLHVIVDNEPINNISGWDEKPEWQSLYPCVAVEDGTYEVSLCYIKDDSDNAGEDTVYIKNVRIIDASGVDTPTYLRRQAATTADGFTYSYAELFFSEKDGYYHVGSENGPLLLANLMKTSHFTEENYIWGLVYEGGLTVDGTDYTEALQKFCSYASNSNLEGFCPVTKELYVLLGYVDSLYGFDDADNMEWMKACVYYQAYGSGGQQMEDPIKGLAPFSAYTAKLGKNVPTNYFTYNRVIMPRGMLAKFVPTRSGVYRITSHCETIQAPNGWIFDENHEEMYVYEPDERLFSEEGEISMVYYMKAGTAYYIDIAFWDPSEFGTIYYDIEYVSSTLQHFRRCSQNYFTYDSDATGNAMYYLIPGGIDVVLGDDGIYYHDMGDGKKGSKIYADFTGIFGLFDSPLTTTQAYDENGRPLYKDGQPVMVKGLIDKNAFDFSKNENDQEILNYMALNDNDPEKTRAYLKEQWGADYDTYAEIYQVEDVFAGKYHGTGPNLTEEMREYARKIITSGGQEIRGCVVVDQRLAEILQLLMDKYTFTNNGLPVENAWIKLCYYYDYLGPNG